MRMVVGRSEEAGIQSIPNQALIKAAGIAG
jgi:hypothetical protein